MRAAAAASTRLLLRPRARGPPCNAANAASSSVVVAVVVRVARRWRTVPLEKAGGGATPVRTGHCATVHAGRLLLFGGLNDEGSLMNDLYSVSLIE